LLLCRVHQGLGGRFGIKGFPTLKWFPAGSQEPEEFSGGRSAADIVSWINDKAGTKAFVKKVPLLRFFQNPSGQVASG
jgi:protein disulfide-isomerase A6